MTKIATSANTVGYATAPQVSFTRPANTTAYTIGDVVNDGGTAMMTFTIGRAAPLGTDQNNWLIGGLATSSVAPATVPVLDLMLFSTNFAIAADNAVFAPSDAELLTLCCIIEFSNFKTLSLNQFSMGSVLTPYLLTPVAGGITLFGVFVARNAYTPASGEVISATPFIDQN